ncbi:hypothetical protein P2Q00_49635 [Streptomyces coacervatus]|nr:hypothetical protein [Streptomyces coacervatus]MDF2273395.1 hypothetical protein [Streptomyces coacervatus]
MTESGDWSRIELYCNRCGAEVQVRVDRIEHELDEMWQPERRKVSDLQL